MNTAPFKPDGAVAVPTSRFLLHLLTGAATSGLCSVIWIFVIRNFLQLPQYEYALRTILECVIFGAIVGLVVSRLTIDEYGKLLMRSSLLQRLISGTSAGVWILDENRRTIYTNRSMHQILDSVPLEGSHMREFFPRESWQTIEQHLQMRPDGIASAYQVEISRPDGTIRILQVLGSPIIVDPKRYLGSFGIFIDITDQIEDQESMVRRERLQTLIATVSRLNHKINNSLMVIRGQAEVLLRRDREGPDAEGFQRIITAADSIAEELQALTELEQVEFEPLTGDNFMVRIPKRGAEPPTDM